MGNPSVDFHDDVRSNATYESTTDPQARLAKKGAGKEAKLAFSGHALMENRNGLCLDIHIMTAHGYAEREEALKMLARQRRKRIKPKTLGADKGYHTKRLRCHACDSAASSRTLPGSTVARLRVSMSAPPGTTAMC